MVHGIDAALGGSLIWRNAWSRLSPTGMAIAAATGRGQMYVISAYDLAYSSSASRLPASTQVAGESWDSFYSLNVRHRYTSVVSEGQKIRSWELDIAQYKQQKTPWTDLDRPTALRLDQSRESKRPWVCRGAHGRWLRREDKLQAAERAARTINDGGNTVGLNAIGYVDHGCFAAHWTIPPVG